MEIKFIVSRESWRKKRNLEDREESGKLTRRKVATIVFMKGA